MKYGSIVELKRDSGAPAEVVRQLAGSRFHQVTTEFEDCVALEGIPNVVLKEWLKVADGCLFRREDTEEILEIPFGEAMMAESGIFVRLDDGVYARRIYQPGSERKKTTEKSVGPKPIISDNLGCPAGKEMEFQKQAREWGFTDIEFKKDPKCPDFYQLHSRSPSQYRAYLHKRSLMDKNSRNGSGAMLSESQMEGAKSMVQRKFAKRS